MIEKIENSSKSSAELRGWVFNLSIWVGNTRGWRRRGLATLAGVLSAAALPPLHAIPVLIVSFPCLVWLIDSAPNWRRAFHDGWWFGLGHFFAGLYWIAVSLTVDLKFVWLMPFSLFCIPAVIGIYIAAATALARIAKKGLVRIILFSASWTLFEWLRGHLFTGFPWNGIGLVWAYSEFAVQIASYIGLIGLGLLTVFGASSLAALAYEKPPVRIYRFLPILICFVVIFVTGHLRLNFGENSQLHSDIHLRIVQPNIPQRVKWSKTYREKHLSTLLKLSLLPSNEPITLTIWPETASPFVVALDPNYRKAITTMLSANGFLLTGSIRTSAPNVHPFRIWNSLHAISSRGRVVMTYDKFHLVPFGEFIPFGSFLVKYLGLKKLTVGRIDFSPGPGPQTISLPDFPSFSPTICYEIIFPDKVRETGSRPSWLLNITNDAWFGNSSGPYQHFAMARMRAVEQGVPLIRAANTGISGIIDPFGRVMKYIPLKSQGIIDSRLPKPISRRTVYSRTGDWVIIGLVILVVCGSICFRRGVNGTPKVYD